MNGDLREILNKVANKIDNLTPTLLVGTRNTDKPVTHHTLYGPKAKWNIFEQSIFWDTYCNLVENGASDLCMAERPEEYMPLIVDCTFRFYLNDDIDRDLYDERFIANMVSCYQTAIGENVAVTQGNHEYIAVVLVSDKHWYENDHIVTQIRLQFPFCVTDIQTQINRIRPSAIKYLNQRNVISSLESSPSDNWEKIIDPYGPRESVLMYGSQSQSGKPVLKFEYLYGTITDAHLATDNSPFLEPSDVFPSPLNHTDIVSGRIDTDIFNSSCKELNDTYYWFPIFLSVRYSGKIAKLKSRGGNDLNRSNIESVPYGTPVSGVAMASLTSSRISDDDDNDQYQSDIDLAGRFISMLSAERVTNITYWLDVGKALYTTFQGSVTGLNLWIRFTEDGYNTGDLIFRGRDDCEEYWPEFKNNRLTLKTLAWYARKDSPVAYDIWHKEWCAPDMEKATSCLDRDVARALYKTYWLDFVCSNFEKTIWYMYKGDRHRWFDHGKTELLIKISGDFSNRFERLRAAIGGQIAETNDSDRKDKYESIHKKITKLINQLKSNRFKATILKECKEDFFCRDFYENIDLDPSIIGVRNCVIECTKSNAFARDGKPEDYVTRCCETYYPFEYSWEHPKVKQVWYWLRQTFVDDELVECFVLLLSSLLYGRNSDKIFPVWSGENGDNSKSMWVKALQAVFGQYCLMFDSSMITTSNKNFSKGPSPELARAEAARVAIMAEPDESEPLKGNDIKLHTGGEKRYARNCGENGKEMDTTYTLILMCNVVPEIPKGGNAVKNRFTLMPFLSTWVKNAPATEEEQFAKRLFPKDLRFEDKITGMAPAILWIMVQKFEIYLVKGITEPKVVKEYTESYWLENDVYARFINDPENICRAMTRNQDGNEIPDTNATLAFGALYLAFKRWFKNEYPNRPQPESTEAKKEFLKRLGKQNARKQWVGIRLTEVDTGSKLAGGLF